MQFTQQLISGGKTLFYAWFEAMHTRVDMAFVVEATRTDMQQIASEIETEIVKYEKITNRFSPESELSFVNENAFGKAVAISPELCKILADCRDFNIQTLGYFDITVYSLNGCKNRANAFVVRAEHRIS